MKRSRSTIQTFLLDTNVLIAAVKNPTRRKAALKAVK
jgi:predicted nucleic acid-binding protein